MVVIGIALFTYHKYRKTVDSNVTLDEHGNVIQLSDENLSGERPHDHHDDDVELIASSYDSRPIHSPVSWLKACVQSLKRVPQKSRNTVTVMFIGIYSSPAKGLTKERKMPKKFGV